MMETGCIVSTSTILSGGPLVPVRFWVVADLYKYDSEWWPTCTSTILSGGPLVPVRLWVVADLYKNDSEWWSTCTSVNLKYTNTTYLSLSRKSLAIYYDFLMSKFLCFDGTCTTRSPDPDKKDFARNTFRVYPGETTSYLAHPRCTLIWVDDPSSKAY